MLIPPSMINSFDRPTTKNVSVLVPAGEVARMQPPVGVEGRRGCLPLLVIPLHYPVTAKDDLARLATRQFSALSIDDLDLETPR